MDAARLRFEQVPSRAELANGQYQCLTCNPVIKVQADGLDHPVTGYPYDTLNVKILDANRVEILQKMQGRILERFLYNAGVKSQTVSITTYPPDGSAPVSATVVDRRIGVPLPGMHLVSGAWQMEQADNISDTSSTITIDQTADGIRLTSGTGEHYEAKFDGRDYPDQGTTETDTVSLRRIDTDTIEETDKLKGRVVSVNRLTVSADRQSLRVSVRLPEGRTQVLVFQRQGSSPLNNR